MIPAPRTMARIAWAVALAAAPLAHAQQFTVQRSFDHVRSNGTTGQPLQNVYWVSLPLDPVVDDACNAFADRLDSRCVGDPGGPTSGDGVLDACDLLCAWWTARSNPATSGVMVISRWESATCELQELSGSWGFRGRMSVAGELFAVDPTEGYQVRVAVPVGARYNPRNPVVLRGDPDPSWPGTRIVTPQDCGIFGQRGYLLAFPYDAAYTSAPEIGCGLRTVDWVDETDVAGNPGPDGNPDTCWDDLDGDRRYDAGEPLTGVYDGVHGIAVERWDNTPDVNGPFVWQVSPGFPSGRLNFNGPAFDLTAGEAYYLAVTNGIDSLYRPPTR